MSGKVLIDNEKVFASDGVPSADLQIIAIPARKLGPKRGWKRREITVENCFNRK